MHYNENKKENDMYSNYEKRQNNLSEKIDEVLSDKETKNIKRNNKNMIYIIYLSFALIFVFTIIKIGTIKTTTISGENKVIEKIEVNTKEIIVTGIEIVPSNLELGKSQTTLLKVNYTPANATKKSIKKWKSSNTGIVTVDTMGKVTAINPGTATITAITSNGKSATCNVTIKGNSSNSIPTKIILNYSGTQELEVGKTLILKATVQPSTTNDSLTWTSSNNGVAIVSNGVVIAKSEGISIITAKTSNGLQAKVTIKVKKIDEQKKDSTEIFRQKKVNELGEIPIMMYHQVLEKAKGNYLGGNATEDGYARTSTGFLNDLEFYYNKGYRMIRLNDYINGIINVPMGYSPIILTFDDGMINNFKVIKKNTDGSLEFDPNSAIGILEKFKKMHPDMNVTATFFLHNGLCHQPSYDADIIKWLVNHGYDVGNHSLSHDYLNKISKEKVYEEIGTIYQKFDAIIPNKYVHIVALPFGVPSRNHVNFQYIIDGTYNGKKYHTDAVLGGGTEMLSPFHKKFDKYQLHRIKAYDNNGTRNDITATFKALENTKFISDGSSNYVTIPSANSANLNKTSLTVIKY